MTVIGLLIVILLVALGVYLVRLLVPDAMAQRVLIILICVLAVLYVLNGLGVGGMRLTR